MKTILFSDVHLNVAPDGRESMERFVRFLRQIDPSECDRIVILGDLFDFWFEYRHVIFSGYFDVLRALADLREAGIAFHFCCGNHDFWAGRFLEEHLGFHIYFKPALLPFGEKRGLLVHGDGINPKDVGYRIYKYIARARPVVWVFGLLHPDWAMRLAQAVSRSSRHLAQKRDLSEGTEVRPLAEYARRALERGEADIVFCGHSHYPVIESYPTPNGSGYYVNTGDWLYHRSFVEWDGVTFQMRSFQAECAAEPQSGHEPSRAYQ